MLRHLKWFKAKTKYNFVLVIMETPFWIWLNIEFWENSCRIKTPLFYSAHTDPSALRSWSARCGRRKTRRNYRQTPSKWFAFPPFSPFGTKQACARRRTLKRGSLPISELLIFLWYVSMFGWALNMFSLNNWFWKLVSDGEKNIYIRTLSILI